MNIVLLGPPGSGKGTVGARIADTFGLVTFDAGSALRERALNGSPEERELLRPVLERGATAPTPVMMAIYRDWIRTQFELGHGVLSAGIPRGEQAEYFLRDVREGVYGCDAVLWLDASEDVLTRRLVGRLTCSSCGEIYHVEFRPPANPDSCDRCGSTLFRRQEDTRLDLVRARIAEQTALMRSAIDQMLHADVPVITIDATRPINEVLEEAIHIVNLVASPRRVHDRPSRQLRRSA